MLRKLRGGQIWIGRPVTIALRAQDQAIVVGSIYGLAGSPDIHGAGAPQPVDRRWVHLVGLPPPSGAATAAAENSRAAVAAEARGGEHITPAARPRRGQDAEVKGSHVRLEVLPRPAPIAARVKDQTMGAAALI